jgi:hypothetical protein
MMKTAIHSFCCVLTGILCFYGSIGHAQSNESAESKAERIREILKEKALKSVNSPSAAKITKITGNDSRLTNNAFSVVEGEVSIAVDPTDSNNLVASFMKQGTSGLDFPVYYSSNGGQSWSLSTFSAYNQLAVDFAGMALMGGGDPAFAWDKNGKLYFAWIYLTLNSTQDTAFFTLNWAYSTNKGVSWIVEAGPNHFIGRGAIDMQQNVYNYYDGMTDREWLAVDNSGGPNQGNLYCSFVCFPPGSAATFEAIKVKTPAATAFGPMVTTYVGQSQFGNVEVDASGKVHVSMADENLMQILYNSSSNGGASFGTAQIVGTGTQLAPSSFQMPLVVHSRENSAPNLAADGQGNLHIVYSNFPGTEVHSYYTHSLNGGLTWSTPVLLDTLFGNKQTIMPTVAASGNKVTISTTAFGNATDLTPDSARYYQIASMDEGQTFSAPFLVSSTYTNYVPYTTNTNDFFGDYFRSQAFGCNVYATWSDGRNGLGPKIYFAKTNSCTIANGNTGVNNVSCITSGIQLQKVYPNPATDHILLTINANKSQDADINISDISGKIVAVKHITLNSGAQNITLNTQLLKAGNYILSLQGAEGLISSLTISIK